MKPIIGIVTSAILIYLVVIFILYFLQEKLLFFPQPLEENVRRMFSRYEIAIQSGDIRLSGWFIKGEATEKELLIIYFGGNAEEVSGNILSIGRIRASCFLLMNYRGYGDSEGSPSQSALLADAINIYDEIVRKRSIQPEQVVLMGRSLGSGVAVYLASKRFVKGLILVAPYDSLVNVAKFHYPIFPVKWLMKHPFDSLQLAPHIQFPVLNLMASNDTIVPNRLSENLMKGWGGKTSSVMIQGAHHNDISQFDQYWKAINRFLTNE